MKKFTSINKGHLTANELTRVSTTTNILYSNRDRDAHQLEQLWQISNACNILMSTNTKENQKTQNITTLYMCFMIITRTFLKSPLLVERIITVEAEAMIWQCRKWKLATPAPTLERIASERFLCLSGVLVYLLLLSICLFVPTKVLLPLKLARLASAQEQTFQRAAVLHISPRTPGTSF